MRSILTISIFALAAAPAFAQRITASPTLPRAGSELTTAPKAAPPSLEGLQAEQLVHAREGMVVGRIAEIVRNKEGSPTRIILVTSDGLRRYAPAADMQFENGRAVTRLSLAEVFALPKVEG